LVNANDRGDRADKANETGVDLDVLESRAGDGHVEDVARGVDEQTDLFAKIEWCFQRAQGKPTNLPLQLFGLIRAGADLFRLGSVLLPKGST